MLKLLSGSRITDLALTDGKVFYNGSFKQYSIGILDKKIKVISKDLKDLK